MALAAGDKLGPYEIMAPIGAGGMGEVFRARDTMLKREVALKVLPAEFVQDPERMARFQREAEVLASLDHPNIGPIYGLVESDGSRSLVLALIEGPTLADHLRSGPLPQEEAIAIAHQQRGLKSRLHGGFVALNERFRRCDPSIVVALARGPEVCAVDRRGYGHLYGHFAAAYR
jgi:hypothetical protein